jgi:hypothetical protein
MVAAFCRCRRRCRCRCRRRCRRRCRCRCRWTSVPRNTGLPSRSALVAPPLRLAALRWPEAFIILARSRPPPVVSTAFLPAVARFSVAPFPGEPHTALCPTKLGRWRHNAVYCTPAGAPRFVSPIRACESRAPLNENRPIFARRAAGGCPAPVPRAPGVRRRRCARGARNHVLSGTRDSRPPRCTNRGATVRRAPRGSRERCLAPAGRFPPRRVARPFQRRLAPPREFRRASFGSSAPAPRKTENVPGT